MSVRVRVSVYGVEDYTGDLRLWKHKDRQKGCSAFRNTGKVSEEGREKWMCPGYVGRWRQGRGGGVLSCLFCRE